MNRIPLFATATVVLAFVAGSCTSGGSKPAASGTSPTAAPTRPSVQPSVTAVQPSTSLSGGVDPNAPEINAAGDIPDNQVFVIYASPSGGFSVKVPEGWARTETGGAVTFTDKLNRVRIEAVAAPSAPTVQSAQQQEVPAIAGSVKSYEAGRVTTITRKAGAAVLITYRADAAPDPVTGKAVHDDVERYEFWKAGKSVILTLSGPQGADNVDPWKIVTDSFEWR